MKAAMNSHSPHSKESGGLVVLCVGDSITQNSPYPARLQELLGPKFHVRNAGCSGASLLRRGAWPYHAFPEYGPAMEIDAEIVVAMLGTNDSKPENFQYMEDFGKDFQALLADLRTNGRKPRILVALPPLVVRPLKGIDELRLEPVRLALRRLAMAEELPLLDLPAALRGHEDDFSGDGVHPSATGGRRIGDAVYTALLENGWVTPKIPTSSSSDEI